MTTNTPTNDNALFDILAGGTGYTAEQAYKDANRFTMVGIVNHMHQDHKMSVKKLANRFKVSEAEIKAILFK